MNGMLELEARTLRRRGPVATRRWLPVPVPGPGEIDAQVLDEADNPEGWRRLVELVTQPDAAWTETESRAVWGDR